MSDDEEIDVEALLRSHGLVSGGSSMAALAAGPTPPPTLTPLEEEDDDDDDDDINVGELLRSHGLTSEEGTRPQNQSNDAVTNSPKPVMEATNLTEDDDIDIDALLKSHGLVLDENPLSQNIVPDAPNPVIEERSLTIEGVETEEEEEDEEIDVEALLRSYGLTSNDSQNQVTNSSVDEIGESDIKEEKEASDEDDADIDIDALLKSHGLVPHPPQTSVENSKPTTPAPAPTLAPAIKQESALTATPAIKQEPAPQPVVKKEVIRFVVGDSPDNSIPSELPDEALFKDFQCRLVGFDAFGYIYIIIPHKRKDRRFYEEFGAINQIYRKLAMTERNNKDLQSELDVAAITEGHLIVVKLQTTLPNNKKAHVFVRAQVISRFPDGTWSVVDIDEQRVYTVRTDQLYPVLKQFYTLPMRVLKCRLDDMNEFLGTGVLNMVVSASGQQHTDYYVRFLKVGNYKSTPSIVLLYHSEMELKGSNGVWSYSNDLLNLINQWNKAPLELIKGMLIPNTLLTRVTRYGKIWVQFQSPLMELLSDLKPLPNQARKTDVIVKEIQEGKRKFVRKLDGKFRRVEVDEHYQHKKFSPNSSDIVVRYIDFGLVVSGDVRDLYPYSSFSKVFEDIPVQGFEAVMSPPSKGLCLKDCDNITNKKGLLIFIDKPSAIPTVTVHLPKSRKRRTIANLNDDDENESSSEQVPSVAHVTCKLPIPKKSETAAGKFFDYKIVDAEDLELRRNFTPHQIALQYEAQV